MPELPINSSNQQLTDPLLNRFFLSSEDKAKKETGKQIVKSIYRLQTSNDQSINYFKGRNARHIELYLWAKGSQRMQEFLDYQNVSDANKAYINLDYTQTRIAAKFVGVLVESMAKNKTYPCVEAIDDGSLSEKEQRYFDSLYRMHKVQDIDEMQQASGLQLEPQNAFVPDDELSAKVYYKLEDRLPKEISFEEYLAFIQSDIDFERIINRKTLYDLIVVNGAFTKIEKCGPKQYTVRKCITTNMIYNFVMNDNGKYDLAFIGEFSNLKVRDFRSKFGKSPSRPDGLTEKQIFELARLSSNKSIGQFNYMWNDHWSMPFNQFNQVRPYDDCNILILDVEVDCGEDLYYVEKTDAFGKKTIDRKSNIPYQQKKKDGTIIEQPKPDDVEIIKRSKQTWMRGVYAPYGDTMLYWGPPDLIISEYTDYSHALSSYSFNIPNNDGEYVPSLFERIMEPLREYQITKLKRKQIIALVEPDGWRIDVESIRNIDLGNGDSISWEEIVRIKNQTGAELWSSKGLNPLEQQAPPITQGAQSTNISKVIELTNVLASIVAEIRDLIGVPTYRDGADVGDRTSGKLAEGQTESSYNVTDYILNANNQLWEDTFNKLCLLHWNDVVKEEPESQDDMLNTRFKVSVKMKLTEYQKQLLEQDIQRFSQMPDANKNPLISPKDALMLREIDNYKLACWYLAHTVETNRRKAIEDSERLQAQNAQVQQASAQQAAQAEKEAQAEKLEAEKDMLEYKTQKEKEVELLKGVLAAAAKDESGQLIRMFLPAIQQLVPNVTIPLAQENQDMQQEAAQQQQQAMMAQMAMQQQNPEEMAEQGAQQNPQEEMMEQQMQ